MVCFSFSSLESFHYFYRACPTFMRLVFWGPKNSNLAQGSPSNGTKLFVLQFGRGFSLYEVGQKIALVTYEKRHIFRCNGVVICNIKRLFSARRLNPQAPSTLFEGWRKLWVLTPPCMISNPFCPWQDSKTFLKSVDIFRIFWQNVSRIYRKIPLFSHWNKRACLVILVPRYKIFQQKFRGQMKT